MTDARTGIARRTLLGGWLAALAGAAGCQRLTDDPLPAAPGLSMRTLTAAPPFFLGWRGGSRDWPEMTTYGFEQAAAIPAILAMELVATQAADSVLVCNADPTTQRVTGLDFTVPEETWANLSGLKVRATETKDPKQPSQPLARLEDFIDRFVFFVEPGATAAVGNLMTKLISLDALVGSPGNRRSTPTGSARRSCTASPPSATSRPIPATTSTLGQSDHLDTIGASISHPKKLLASVLDAARQNDKRPVTWKVCGRGELERAIELGFEGIGSPAIREIIAIER